VALLSAATIVAAVPVRSQAADATGYWAAGATAFQEMRDERRLIFGAPNGRTITIIDGSRIWVRVDGHVRHLDRDVGVGWPAEIAWAPDSKAFFITQTEGRLEGPWSSRVFLVERGMVRVVDPARDVVARFGAQSPCAGADAPNAVAVAWLDGGRQVLVVTEVSPQANCPRTSKLAGWIVAMPSGRVERELTGDALKREYRRLLGPRLVAN